MTFGNHLREAREAKGLSLRKFAKQLGGKPTAAYLSRVERDEVPPPSEEIILKPLPHLFPFLRAQKVILLFGLAGSLVHLIIEPADHLLDRGEL